MLLGVFQRRLGRLRHSGLFSVPEFSEFFEHVALLVAEVLQSLFLAFTCYVAETRFGGR